MDLKIFDVEHGACALLTCENYARIMIDCGHNSTTIWRPGTYLRQAGITHLEMLGISNYDEDHVSALENVTGNVTLGWLWRNQSVSAAALEQIKAGTGGTGLGIRALIELISRYNTGPTLASPLPHFDGLVERSIFYNDYPAFRDTNNISAAMFFSCHGKGVMFTGDLERPGFAELVKRPDFQRALQLTNVYVASHHGREGGCSDDVAKFLANVYYVVISDKGHEHETQKTWDFYNRIAKGGPFREQGTRKVLTTRNDGRIGFNFRSDGWGPY